MTSLPVLLPLGADPGSVISTTGSQLRYGQQLDTCSGVVGAGPGKAMVHHTAVLRLQTEGDVLLNLLTAPQEPAAIPSKLLPRASPVLLLLLSTDEDLVHVVAETHLEAREQSSKSRAEQPLPRK